MIEVCPKCNSNLIEDISRKRIMPKLFECIKCGYTADSLEFLKFGDNK